VKKIENETSKKEIQKLLLKLDRFGLSTFYLSAQKKYRKDNNIKTYDEIVNIVNSILNTTDIKIIQVLFFDIFYDNKIHILDKLSLIKNS